MRPRIVIGVPSEITQVEKRAVKDSAYRAKASEVHLVEEAMAAAIGAGMPITEPSGNMIVDIGGGTTDIAVISLAGIVYSKAVRVAGNEMDEAIIQYIKKTYNLLIGERTAEQIKIEIGSAFPLEERMTMEIKGRHLIEGVPKTITISDEEIREALAETVNVIVDAVRVALERTPPELSADIVDRGIVLTGGGSLLKNLDKRLREETGPAARDGRGSAVVGRARRGQDAVGLQPAAEDLDRLSSRIPCPRWTFDSAAARYLFLAVVVGQLVLISAQVTTKTGCRSSRRSPSACSPRCSAPAPGSCGGVAGLWTGLRRTCDRSAARTSALKRELGQARIALQQERALARAEPQPRAAARPALAPDGRDRRRPTSSPRRQRPSSGPSRSTRARRRGCAPTWRSSRRRASSGRVIVPSARAAKVQLLIDRNAAAGALVERSRAQGVVIGTGDDRCGWST